MKHAVITKFIIWLTLICLLCGCTGRPADPIQISSDPTVSGQTSPSAETTASTEAETTQPEESATEPVTEPTEITTTPTEPPTEPTETGPKPTEPAPTEPKPTEPAPTEPKPTEPAPTLPPAVTQVDPQPDNPSGDKVIYLTFDDGPGAYTPELLAVLEKYNVKVTFFVIGTAKLEYLDDIAQAGHSIGIHTDTHRYDIIYTSTNAFWKDLNAMENKIYQYTGIHTKLYRFPGGSSNYSSKQYCPGIMTQLVKELEAQGFYYFDWNVDSNDAGGATLPAEVYNNVISAVQKKTVSVVLMHDVKQYTVQAVESILRWGLQNGYVFLPLDESSPNAHHSVNN